MGRLWSEVVNYFPHRGACQLPALWRAGEVRAVFLVLFCSRGRQECCAVCYVLSGCQSSGCDIWCWRDGWELCWPGQTSPRGPSGEMNEKNGNAAKYQVCFLLICQCVRVCVSVWQEMSSRQRCVSQVWGQSRGQTSLSLLLCSINNCGSNEVSPHDTVSRGTQNSALYLLSPNPMCKAKATTNWSW